MKKLSRIVWVLALSIPPTVSAEFFNADQHSSGERKVFCRSEGWENGKKLWEKVEYADTISKEPIRPSGMGAWESGNFGMVEQHPPTKFCNDYEMGLNFQ